MIVLVINCGSSSVKYQLLEMDTEELLCSGVVERIGEPIGSFAHKKYTGGEAHSFKSEEVFTDHAVALKKALEIITSPDNGSIASVDEIKAVGHRVVQGGEILPHATVVDSQVKKDIRKLFKLAPLHNPAHLKGIEVAQELCPHAPSVAVFDTEFHSTMPAEAYRYPLPHKFYNEYGIRRYGFHGTSHKYVSRETAAFMGKPVNGLNLITCHLGNGCSITAIKDGKSIDTTMGLTPLAGTMMGTRTGDMDPMVPIFMISEGYSAEEVDNIMNKQSGFKGLCGMNDLRDIHAAVEKGDKNAKLALDIFCYTVRRQIGAIWACLGRVDGIAFTAGIGENDDIARAGCLEGLEAWGVKLDPAKNATRGGARTISTDDSRVPVMVIPTNEELEIARITLDVLKK